MFNFDDLYKIEIELTTQCQAHCPMCSRNFHGMIPNSNVKKSEWTFEDFKNIINQDVLDRVKRIGFCGAYGDPLICRDILKIVSYIKENSSVEIIINTNGSLHKPEWWKQLATLLPQHLVIIGIDGFRGTHEKHRIGTDFDKIIENARAFIEAGGNAAGQFINFEHNKHEYEELRSYLLTMGFNSVFKINPDRFRKDSFAVLDKSKNKLYDLEPTGEQVISFKDSDIPSIVKNQDRITINCRSIKQRELYIDARRHLYPCCETAAMRYEIERLNEDNFNKVLPLLKSQIRQIQQDYYNLDYIDLTKVAIKDVVSDPHYLNTWKKYWAMKQALICSVVCGSLNNQRLLDRDSQFVF
jgi:MoaA/NifB/PqqE/SkfB family radical SAM enzyme